MARKLFALIPLLWPLSVLAQDNPLLDIQSLESFDVFPRTCMPNRLRRSAGGGFDIYIFDGSSLVSLGEENGFTEEHLYFDVEGTFKFDADNDARNEGYAFGTMRTYQGGSVPPHYSWSEGQWHDRRETVAASIFASGQALTAQDLEDGGPTLIISLSGWICRVLADESGNLSRTTSAVLLERSFSNEGD